MLPYDPSQATDRLSRTSLLSGQEVIIAGLHAFRLLKRSVVASWVGIYPGSPSYV